MRKTLPFAVLLSALFLSSLFAADWKPAEGHILSKFAKDVDPSAPLPEYPRPQMTRSDWMNLNGLWDYAIEPAQKENWTDSQGKILVPYAIQSALSGVGKAVLPSDKLWYQRTFTVPESWSGKRVLLHFGACDWETTVFVNGKCAGVHRGGYTPFTFDISPLLTEGEQTLTVQVWDPTNEALQPRGKQILTPNGIWYTAVTGIWQTIWLEPVNYEHIVKVLPTSNLADKSVAFNVTVAGYAEGATVKINGAEGTVADGEAVVTLPCPDLTPWTPDTPVLQDAEVQLVQDGKVVDQVGTYFALREISLGKTADGITRIFLNGQFLFQHGPLDQGWWPDGLYTAPTDEALRFDVEMTKKFGFNMLRKHVKVEPARFYRHCDELGILVWQDMPSSEPYLPFNEANPAPDAIRTSDHKNIYYSEYRELIENFDVYPSIIMWVPFNEGWGQFETKKVVAFTKFLDPTRLVNCASGWTDRPCGDVHDKHCYPGPEMFPPEESRATVLGEYGGLGLPIPDHSWKTDGNWGYVTFEDKNGLFEKYQSLNVKLAELITKGLSAAVYTQTTDVEIEVNGLMSYDREVIKMPVDKLFESNNALYAPIE